MSSLLNVSSSSKEPQILPEFQTESSEDAQEEDSSQGSTPTKKKHPLADKMEWSELLFGYTVKGIHYRRPTLSKPRKIADFELIDDVASRLQSRFESGYKHVINTENPKPYVLNVPPFAEFCEWNLNDGFTADRGWVFPFQAKLGALCEVLQHKNIDPFQYDFIGVKGVFRIIMCSLLSSDISWGFGVRKVKNTLFFETINVEYIHCVHSPYAEEYNRNVEANFKDEEWLKEYEEGWLEEYESDDNKNAFRIYNLKRMLRSQNVRTPDEKEREYAGIFEAELNRRGKESYKLLYSSELDALVGEGRDVNDPKNFTMIKQKYYNSSQKTFERRRLPEWWALGKLLGIEKFTLAMKRNSHQVTEVRDLPVDSIPDICEDAGWRGDKAIDIMLMDYLRQFLTYAKAVTKDETDHNAIYFLEKQKGADLVDCFRYPGKDWLPEGFLEHFGVTPKDETVSKSVSG